MSGTRLTGDPSACTGSRSLGSPCATLSAPQSPRAPRSRAPIPDLLLGRRQGRPGRARLAVRGPELTAARMGKLRSKWSGMPALAEIAGLAKLTGPSGVGVCQRDFPAVPEARHGLQRDCRPLVRGVLPPDTQELRLRLHRLRPSRVWNQPAFGSKPCFTVSAPLRGLTGRHRLPAGPRN
jgi:hypothetical protein